MWWAMPAQVWRCAWMYGALSFLRISCLFKDHLAIYLHGTPELKGGHISSHVQEWSSKVGMMSMANAFCLQFLAEVNTNDKKCWAELCIGCRRIAYNIPLLATLLADVLRKEIPLWWFKSSYWFRRTSDDGSILTSIVVAFEGLVPGVEKLEGWVLITSFYLADVLAAMLTQKFDIGLASPLTKYRLFTSFLRLHLPRNPHRMNSKLTRFERAKEWNE